MAELTSTNDYSGGRWWPCFVGGLCGPLLGNWLNRWLPLYLAVGVAFLMMWMITGLIFRKTPPFAGYNFVRWMIGGTLGAIVAAAAAFLFPWR